MIQQNSVFIYNIQVYENWSRGPGAVTWTSMNKLTYNFRKAFKMRLMIYLKA
jgi:hypothetical protein